MKLSFRIAASLACGLLAAASLGWNILHSDPAALQANWGFSLPAGAHCALVYEQDEGASFHGDGLRHHVFACQTVDPIDGLFPWAEADPKQTAQAGRWLDALEVPQAQRPIAGQCLTWEIRQNDDPRDTLLARSEEHTSELQSRFDLVCRLLLEKKKKKSVHTSEYQIQK